MFSIKEIALWVVCLLVGVVVSNAVGAGNAIYVWAPVAIALYVVVHLLYERFHERRTEDGSYVPRPSKDGPPPS